VEYQTNFLGYMLAVFSVFIFGFLAIILMPFLVSLTKVAIHRCAKCLNEVKSTSFFDFESLEDKLIAFNIGTMGVILTRKYLLYIVAVITTALCIYLFLLNEVSHNHEIRTLSGYDWAQFRQDCGWEKFQKNPNSALSNFDRKYFNEAVGWEGYVIRISMEDEASMNYYQHTASILIKMEPGDQGETTHGADLALSFSYRVYDLHRDVLDSLHRGDKVQFNATLMSMGDSVHLHHCHTFQIAKLPGHKNVDAHVHGGGRYKFKLVHQDENGNEIKAEGDAQASPEMIALKTTETAK
jgi:hypothetical protein